MSDIEVIFSLPEALVKEATALGILTNAHLEVLLRADIQAQLVAMASDPAIRREIADIQADFAGTDYDGLDTEPIHKPCCWRMSASRPRQPANTRS